MGENETPKHRYTTNEISCISFALTVLSDSSFNSNKIPIIKELL